MAIDRTKAPELHSFEPLTLPAEEVRVLPNGATLHIVDSGDQEVSVLNVLFPGGAVEEAPSPAGTIYGQTLFEGTGRRSPQDVAELLDYHGARHSPLAKEHYTGFRMVMLNSQAAPLLRLCAEVMAVPLFGDREVTAAKTAALARLNYRRQQMSQLATEALAPLLFGAAHPVALSPSEADIAAVTPGVLRSFHRHHSNPRGAHAFLAGKLTPALTAACEEFLLSLGSDGAPVAPAILPFTPATPARTDIVREQAVQSAIAMGAVMIPRSHPDYHTLRLTIMGLGGYFGSRLMSNIREDKGLTYGISAALYGLAEGSHLGINAQCSRENVETVIAEVGAEMRAMVTNPPEGDELERLRRHAFSEALETLDTPFNISGHYSNILTLNMPSDYFLRQQQAIAALSPEIIAAMAARYLRPEALSIATAGPD